MAGSRVTRAIERVGQGDKKLRILRNPMMES